MSGSFRDRAAKPPWTRGLLACACLAAEGLAVTFAGWAAVLASRAIPGVAAPSLSGDPGLAAAAGPLAGLLAVLFTLLRTGPVGGVDLARDTSWRRAATIWHATILTLLAIAVLTRSADALPPAAMVLFYLFGFAALWGARRGTTQAVRAAGRLRWVPAQRIVIVGTEPAIQDFVRRYRPWTLGLEIVGSYALTPLPGGGGEARERLAAQLRPAIEIARDLALDDVYVALPWSETDTIDQCVEAFLTMPIAIHLAPERVLDRFERVTIMRRGDMASLELTRPMPPAAALAKRALDLAAAFAALVILSPLLVVVAALIKLDTPGPVLFRQTRHGYNQRPFRIFKFRSMTTYQDGGPVPQARVGDARITRVGRVLRRSNLDELPQLLNVLLGQMSLVGPRPHAVPHNQVYERRIALYARRHNVKPGITGWAQIHGLRGETDTDDKMRRRVAFDLFYIDHWSLGLDLRILLLTVFSSQAYRNAV